MLTAPELVYEIHEVVELPEPVQYDVFTRWYNPKEHA